MIIAYIFAINSEIHITIMHKLKLIGAKWYEITKDPSVDNNDIIQCLNA